MTDTPRKLREELLFPRSSNKGLYVSMCQLKMKKDCCLGTGFQIDTEGTITRAKICQCIKTCAACCGQARYNRPDGSRSCKEPNPLKLVNLINGAGVPSRYGTSRLDRFSNFTGNGKQVVNQVAKWLSQNTPKASRGMIIEGNVGVGKTYILAGIALQWAKQGRSVKFVDFFQLLAQLRSAYSTNQADESLLRPLIDVDLLIIDELGKGRNNDWELSILDQLVMGRYNQNKIVVASTNYKSETGRKVPLAQLDLTAPQSRFREDATDQTLEDRVGERIFSRLTETCDFLKLEGQDFRRMKRSGLNESTTRPTS